MQTLRHIASTVGILLLCCLGAAMLATSASAAEPTQLRARLLSDIRSTDPGVNRDGTTDSVVMHIVEGLVALAEDTSIVPMLAASYDIAKDGVTYTFRLRRGIHFHNGALLTAGDVAWALKRYFDPATKWRCLPEVDGRGQAKVVAVEAPNAETVVIRLERPAPLFLTMLSRPDCGGTGIIHRSSVGADGSWKAPIGTGPYKLGEWKRGQYLELKRFDKYQARSEPASGYAGGKKAEVDTIRFLVVPDSASAKAALLGGSVDILPDVNESELADIQSKSNIKVDISTTPGISGILFNTRDPVMRDVRIRRAIALAIDGKELVSGTTNDLAKLNNSAMPSISPFYTEVQRTGFVPNIAEAKRLLKEAGYNGRPIKILANKRYGTMYDTALIAQGLAAYAGIRLEVEVLDWATQLDRYTRGNYQMMAFAYTSRLDPSLVYDMLVGPKATQTQKVWDNAEVQALVAESMRETDKAKRQAIFDELHRRMLQDVPLIVYWNGIQITAYHKRVVGFRQWPMEHPRYWLVRMKP